MSSAHTHQSLGPLRAGPVIRLGAGRIAVGAAIGAAPVGFLRLLGVDSATAARVSWLTRMLAARDALIGTGTVIAARRGAGAASWLLAGAAADAADAVLVAGAVRSGRLSGPMPAATVVAAAGGAVAAALAAHSAAR